MKIEKMKESSFLQIRYADWGEDGDYSTLTHRVSEYGPFAPGEEAVLEKTLRVAREPHGAEEVDEWGVYPVRLRSPSEGDLLAPVR